MTEWEVWAVIGGLAGVTFLVRYSFLGLLGGRVLPGWLTMALGFVPVTVLPALVAPALILGPEELGTLAPLPVLLAGAVTLATGILTRSLFGAFVTGVVAYHGAALAGW